MSAHHDQPLECACGNAKPAHLHACPECEDATAEATLELAYRGQTATDRHRGKQQLRTVCLLRRPLDTAEVEAHKSARA